MISKPSVIGKPSKSVVDPEGMYHPEQVLTPRNRHEWTWLILAGVFLGISGGHRYWRDWQFQSLSKENQSSPFPLKEFPRALGKWHEVEGLETRLDDGNCQDCRVERSRDPDLYPREPGKTWSSCSSTAYRNCLVHIHLRVLLSGCRLQGRATLAECRDPDSRVDRQGLLSRGALRQARRGVRALPAGLSFVPQCRGVEIGRSVQAEVIPLLPRDVQDSGPAAGNGRQQGP